MIGRAIAFVAIFAGLQFAWGELQGSTLQHVLIDRGIVGPAAAVARAITPALDVHAIGNQIRDGAGGLNIVNGCDGMETLFLLIAAFAVAPLGPRARVGGMLAGIPVIYVLNQARILALYYAHHRDARLFDVLHGIVTPLLMVLAVLAYFYAWLRRHSARDAAAA